MMFLFSSLGWIYLIVRPSIFCIMSINKNNSSKKMQLLVHLIVET